MRLTSMVKSSGCAAKLNPADLEKTLKKLHPFSSENLIVGFETNDDALVYKVNDDLVMVSSLDFFPPMVDDPYTFGMIAAANSISDIYAMGATPSVAMNITCFPSCIPLDILKEILQGGIDKAKEAGVTIAGGHTIEDSTPKYGLSVTGFAHPNEILKNCSCSDGDLLVLTKPLGVGLINTAAKVDLATKASKKIAEESMMQLNKYAKECLAGLNIHSLTDITGFGLAGHSYEMAKSAQKTIEIYSSSLPIIPGAIELARQGIIPAGTYNNQNYLDGKYSYNGINQAIIDVIFDPQTSGGFLVSLPEKDAHTYLRRCEEFTQYASIVGKVVPKKDKDIIIR